MHVARRTTLNSTDRGSWGVAFPVDRVPLAGTPLPEVPMPSLPMLSGEPLVVTSHEASVVDTGPSHPLASAVHLAFSEHRPLVLSPDVLWITLAEGVAAHIRQCAEEV